eukprot:Rhum_TRINITY_DN14181_c6_g2::Rhum_TRINITY_DN14181_c6_g2_i1::g.72465::m.72465
MADSLTHDGENDLCALLQSLKMGDCAGESSVVERTESGTETSTHAGDLNFQIFMKGSGSMNGIATTAGAASGSASLKDQNASAEQQAFVSAAPKAIPRLADAVPATTPDWLLPMALPQTRSAAAAASAGTTATAAAGAGGSSAGAGAGAGTPQAALSRATPPQRGEGAGSDATPPLFAATQHAAAAAAATATATAAATQQQQQ